MWLALFDPLPSSRVFTFVAARLCAFSCCSGASLVGSLHKLLITHWLRNIFLSSCFRCLTRCASGRHCCETCIEQSPFDSKKAGLEVGPVQISSCPCQHYGKRAYTYRTSNSYFRYVWVRNCSYKNAWFPKTW